MGSFFDSDESYFDEAISEIDLKLQREKTLRLQRKKATKQLINDLNKTFNLKNLHNAVELRLLDILTIYNKSNIRKIPSGYDYCGDLAYRFVLADTVVGYALQNISNVELHYLKAEYTESGLKFHKAVAKPNERFVITRHELAPLNLLNGNRLLNGIIVKGGEDSIHRPDYIRRYNNSDVACKRVGEEYDGDGNLILFDEYKDTFHWVNMKLYFKKLKNNKSKYIYNYTVKDNEILIDDDFVLRKTDKLHILSNRTEEDINKLIAKVKILGNCEVYKRNGYIFVDLCNEKTTRYVISNKKIVIYPRKIFRYLRMELLDLKEAKLYSNNLSNTFFDSKIDNLIIGETESVNVDGLNKILDNLRNNCNVVSDNKDIALAIRQYNERG